MLRFFIFKHKSAKLKIKRLAKLILLIILCSVFRRRSRHSL